MYHGSGDVGRRKEGDLTGRVWIGKNDGDGEGRDRLETVVVVVGTEGRGACIERGGEMGDQQQPFSLRPKT